MIKCSNIGDAEPGGAMVVVVVCCCLRRLLLFVAAHVGVGYCDAHTMRTGRHGSSCGLLFITTPLYVGKQYCDAPLMRTHPPVMKVGFFCCSVPVQLLLLYVCGWTRWRGQTLL
jgi:hypothetical protein